MAPSPEPPAQSSAGGQTLQAFAVPGFPRVWAGSMIWYSARWMDLFVLQWQVLVMTDSALQVTLIGFYRMVPMLLLGLFTGLVADRFDRRTIILWAQLWNAAVSAIIALLALAGILQLWHLALLVTALGVSWALDLPTRRSYIYDLTGPRRVVNAMALEHLGMDGAKMLGPLLGGLLWPVVGVGGCFLLLSAGYLATFSLYLGLPPAPTPSGSGEGSPLRNLADGLAYVGRSPVILGVLAVTATMNFLVFPYQHLAPVVAKQTLGLGPRLAGLLLACDGLGATAGSLLVASRGDVDRKGRTFALGSCLLMASVVIFSLSRWFPLSCLLLFLAGIGTACFAALQSSLVLLNASEAMRSRAMGTLILAIGFGPLGAIHAGALASVLGAPLTMTLIAGMGGLLLAFIIHKATALRNFRTAA